MKYKSISMEGTYYDLTNKLNNSEALQGFELISFYSYTTDTNICKTVAILKCSELKNAECCVERATPVLHFGEHFSKLNDEEFTTIRDRDKGIVVGDVVNIEAPEGRKFKARCVCVENVKFGNISRELLGKDLDMFEGIHNKFCYLKEIQKYYPDLKMDNIIWIYTLKRV